MLKTYISEFYKSFILKSTTFLRIAALATNVDSGESPIKQEIDHFIKIISGIAVAIGIIFFILAKVYIQKKIPEKKYFLGHWLYMARITHFLNRNHCR